MSAEGFFHDAHEVYATTNDVALLYPGGES